MAIAEDRKRNAYRQGVIGLSLAAAVITAWIVAHISFVFFFEVGSLTSWLLVPFAVALQCWLYVGLFIVAHDCMHGSLFPYKPWINRNVGRFCLFVYAGFSFDNLQRKHHLHHAHAGTEHDPDYDERPPHSFFIWYLKFFAEYFSGREFFIIAAQTALYLFVLGAAFENILLFWALPAALSSMQLFTFGTYLPHRPESAPFSDKHNARSNDLPEWLSLLTCFHFGYHHEHHDRPALPWWQLPKAKREAEPHAGVIIGSDAQAPSITG
ncbi:MAG: fatty acid desaturase [Pseudomonadota bacterium]